MMSHHGWILLLYMPCVVNLLEADQRGLRLMDTLASFLLIQARGLVPIFMNF